MQKRIVCILQPNYLPYIGYYDLIYKCDDFVIYDDVQYTKNDWRNRNQIKTPQGSMWLTVPVLADNRMTEYRLIKDIQINNDIDWSTKHMKSLLMNYTRAPYFREVYELLGEELEKKWHNITDLNNVLNSKIVNYLGFSKRFYSSHALGVGRGSGRSERIVEICKALEATHYLSGDAAKAYLNEKLFNDEGMRVVWHNYTHPVYKQLWGEFKPYMSIVDVLFNHGKSAFNIIKEGSCDKEEAVQGNQ